MLPGFSALIEERILTAQKNGEMDNLPGKGKPLNLEDMDTPEEIRMAYRILKNSGFLPPEVELRKKIGQMETLLAAVEEDTPERIELQKKLNLLFVKLNTMRGISSPVKIPEQYRASLAKRIV